MVVCTAEGPDQAGPVVADIAGQRKVRRRRKPGVPEDSREDRWGS